MTMTLWVHHPFSQLLPCTQNGRHFLSSPLYPTHTESDVDNNEVSPSGSIVATFASTLRSAAFTSQNENDSPVLSTNIHGGLKAQRHASFGDDIVVHIEVYDFSLDIFQTGTSC